MTEEAPIIDWDMFAKTRGELGPGFVRILGYFREDGVKSVATIEAAMRAGNAGALVLPAHTLKSEARMFGDLYTSFLDEERAEELGAAPLADDLGALLGRGRAVVVDQHLARPPGTGGALLAEALADLSAHHRALGVLVALGATPEEAGAELRRRAEAGGVPAPTAARTLIAATLTAPVPDPQPGGDPW